MKNWLKNIPKEKLQRFLFLGVLVLVFVAFFISLSLVKPKEDPPSIDPEPPIDKPIEPEIKETFALPVDGEFIVVREFYEAEADQELLELAFHKMGSRYYTSSGISWSNENGEAFDVYAAMSGTVKSIKEDTLYGTTIVIEHADDFETHYVSLSNILVTEGQEIKQGTKLGVSSINTYDDLDAHIHLKVFKNSKRLNPLTIVGKELSEIQ